MKTPQKIILFAALLVVGTVIMEQVGAFSIREFFGLDEPESDEGEKTAASAQQQDWAKPSTMENNGTMEFQDVEVLFANITAQQRQAYLDNDEAFKQFVTQEAAGRSVLLAAHANNVAQNRNIGFLMQRAADNVLREAYINQLIKEKMPADFPTEQQLVDYYENNKEKFVLPERVQLWQIFFELEDGMDDDAIDAVRKEAEDVATRLKRGTLDFPAAALEYSDHGPSRENGGNMGLLKVSELLPALSETVLNTKDNAVTDPIRTDTGFHIIKRGSLVSARDVGFDEIRGQLEEAVRNQAGAQFRQAIYEQAQKTYPVVLDEKKLEEWRIRLRTGLE